MPSLWVHAAWAPLDLLVELAAVKAAVKQLAPLAPKAKMVAEERQAVRLEAQMAEVAGLDPAAAAAVVEPVSNLAMNCELPRVSQRRHLERGPWWSRLLRVPQECQRLRL